MTLLSFQISIKKLKRKMDKEKLPPIMNRPNRLKRLPSALIQRIVEFYVEPTYKLLDWIVKDDNIEFPYVYEHPCAMDVVRKDIRYMNWQILCRNPNAMPLLRANMDKINWYELSRNSGAVPLLEANMDKVCWSMLSANFNAMHLIEANMDKVDWYALCANFNAIHLIEANMDKVHWDSLSTNKNAVHLLEANQDKINWVMLALNRNAVHLLEANQDKINHKWLTLNPHIVSIMEKGAIPIDTSRFGWSDWSNFCKHPESIPFLRAHPERINWYGFSKNPGIFEMDVEEMRKSVVEMTRQLL
jgi:hypothetical protein